MVYACFSEVVEEKEWLRLSNDQPAQPLSAEERHYFGGPEPPRKGGSVPGHPSAPKREGDPTLLRLRGYYTS